MMLLLVRLISFPLLLPRPLVKTSFSLLRRWRFLPPRSIIRFVLEVMLRCREARVLR
ncbi:hypothetical protein [Anaplasma phagocytophilum]|uniref:hypothetical protein n=1 Tax=Anaplasma phagocytophilum TaxID=948 RepID=UPI00187C1D11|nr:hypothetical protein [Anaplasma phagocytophilum]